MITFAWCFQTSTKHRKLGKRSAIKQARIRSTEKALLLFTRKWIINMNHTSNIPRTNKCPVVAISANINLQQLVDTK